METGADQSPAPSGQEFALRSGVRRAHKREFDFAVKAQAEISAAIGHTRTRKAPEVFAPRSSPPRRRRAPGKKPGVRPPKVPRFPRPPSSAADPVASAPRMAEVVGNHENLDMERFVPVPVVHAGQLSAMPTRIGLGEGCSSSGGEASATVEINGPSETRASSSTTKRLIRNVKELLETGLLEGLTIKYLAGVREKFELQGRIHGGKILCLCSSCQGSKLVNASEFEKHAGSLKKRPADYIVLGNGRTIRDVLEKCQAATVDTVEMTIWNAIGPLPSINNICLRCKQMFHASLSQSSMAICSPCRDLIESLAAQNSGHSHPSASCDGVPTSDGFLSESGKLLRRQNDDLCGKPEDHFVRGIASRSGAETDIDHCEICGQDDFDASRCGPRTVLLCDECDREYHLGCLKDHGLINFEGIPKGKWFCTYRCKEVSLCLQRIIHEREMMLPDIVFSKIMMKNEGQGHLDIKWRLLSGRSTFADNKLLLDSVISIFHESFNPIVGARGRDLIPLITKGSKGQDHRYRGIYCAVLIVGSSVVSAGTLQILRCEVAQLPLIATSGQNRKKGYFQALFHCIQSFLVSLRIRHLLLPAAKEAESMWIEKFGFIKRVPVENFVGTWRQNIVSQQFLQMFQTAPLQLRYDIGCSSPSSTLLHQGDCASSTLLHQGDYGSHYRPYADGKDRMEATMDDSRGSRVGHLAAEKWFPLC